MNEKEESRFESIFNHVNEGILIARFDGPIILVNPKISDMFLYAGEELKGNTVEMLMPERFRDRHQKHRQTYTEHPVRRPMGKDMVLFGLRKDGSEFPLEISLSHYNTPEGDFVIAFIIDITTRFQQQERIAQINHELTQLNESLEKKVNERTLVLKEALHSLEKSRDELSHSLEKEKELNEMKTRFISMASHEFRTPLSTILSSASLISKYAESVEQDKRTKHVERIKNAVHGLTEILNDFLSLGKLDEGVIHTNIVAINGQELLEEVVSEMNMIALPGQQIVYTHKGGELLNTDKQMFRNIFINLLSNAIKFSPADSLIILESQFDEKEWNGTVVDSGIGISKEDQKHLFGRFFRGKNASNIQGTGLGLNIVLKYLELLNGSIQCKSELDMGSTFQVTIPNKK